MNLHLKTEQKSIGVRIGNGFRDVASLIDQKGACSNEGFAATQFESGKKIAAKSRDGHMVRSWIMMVILGIDHESIQQDVDS